MNNLTKEQIKLYTVIGCAVLLAIWLFIPSISISVFGYGTSAAMINALSGLGFLYTIVVLLLMLCPLYLLLYSYKDKMAGLKPIFVLDRKIAGIVLVAVAVVFIILLFAVKPMGIPLSPGFGAWLYLLIAAAICYLGFIEPKDK